MKPTRARRSGVAGRGFGLLELMISATILIVAVLGFVAAMREAVTATAVAHRRTEATLLRTGLLERLAVLRREAVVPQAGRGWIVDGCYDVDAQPVGDNGLTWDAAFACPAGTIYRSWVSAAAIPDATGAAQRIWTVSVYVERTDQSCTPETRFQSVGCVGADLYLTD